MQRYIWELYERRRINEETNAGGVANKILESFINREICTTYQCYKDLKEIYDKKEKSITYKNVHKRVQKLYSLKLIDKAKIKNNGDSTKHGAIFYKLTSFGIFYAIKNNLANFNIITHNKKNELFTHFLYPYIQEKNIEKIKSDSIISYIFMFLKNCCLEIDQYYLERLKELKKEGGFYYAITVIDSIIDTKHDYVWYTGSKDFIQYLKDRFNITWLNIETTKIKEIEKNSIIKIIDGKNELVLTIIPEKQEALLSEGQNIIFKFNIYEIGQSTYGINEFRKMTIGEYISSNVPAFDYNIEKHLTDFCLKVLNSIFLSSYDKEEKYNKEKDLKLLSKDTFFLNLVNNVKNNFDRNYYEFIKIGSQ